MLRIGGLVPGRQVAHRVAAIIRAAHDPLEIRINAVNVAGRAGKIGVRAGEGEVCRRPSMIKCCAQPTVERVAHLAVRREAARHVVRIGRLLIVRLMAGVAGCREPLELPDRRLLVAVFALHCGVGT
jgi:hypothetical protein